MGVQNYAISTFQLFYKPSHIYEQELYRKLGKLVGFFEGWNPVLLIGEPEWIHRILVKDFHFFANRAKKKENDLDLFHVSGNASQWKRLRELASMSLSPFKFRKLTYLVNECAANLVNNLQKVCHSGNVIDVKDYVQVFVMELIANAIFATKINAFGDPKNPFIIKAKQVIAGDTFFGRLVHHCSPKLLKLLRINEDPWNYFHNCVEKITIDRRVAKRSAKFPQSKLIRRRSNFINIMLEVSETVDHVSTIIEEDNDGSAKKCSERERRDSMIIEITEKSSTKELTAVTLLFLSRGYETISETLVSAVYFLSKYPKTQEQLMQEIAENPQAELSYEAMTKLRYLDAVVRETLRLCPPMPRLERECVADYKLGEVTIPAGMKIYVPVYALHRDGEYFEKPNEFNPDRFMSDTHLDSEFDYLSATDTEVRRPFYPFGDGPRSCVGMQFSLFVMKLCLFKLYKNFKFTTSVKTKLEQRKTRMHLNSRQLLLYAEKAPLKAVEV